MTNTRTKWTHKVIATQLWNNNNTQEISRHKNIESAEKMLVVCNKKAKRMQNEYHIEEM